MNVPVGCFWGFNPKNNTSILYKNRDTLSWDIEVHWSSDTFLRKLLDLKKLVEAVKLINDTAAEIWNKAAEMMKL